jgi:hypothetical protein
LRRVADNKVGRRIFNLLLQLPQYFGVVVQFGGDGEMIIELAIGIHLQEGHSVLIVGYFLQLHDLVVVVDGLLIEGVGQQIDDVLVDAFEVENSSHLDIHQFLVGLFASDTFVYHVNFKVLLVLNSRISLSELLLQRNIHLFDLLPLDFDLFLVFLDGPATYSPSIDVVGDLFLLQKFEELSPFHVELQAAHDSIESKYSFLCLASHVLDGS